jgi:Tfp pilus assembly protein PilF
VPREELRNRIWPAEVHVEFEHGLNNAIHRIRETVGESLIETLPRRGYRFLGEVERVLEREPGPARGRGRALAASFLIAAGLLGLLLWKHSAGPMDFEAREAELRGNHFLARKTPESVRKSLSYFDAAVARAPGSSSAHAGRARAYHFLGAMGALAKEEARRLTKEAAERALALDPANGQALAILAESRFRFGGERDGVEDLFRRALGLDPEDAEIRQWYGNFLAIDGRLQEGLQEMESARRLDPLSLHINSDLAILLYEAGKREEAREQFRRTLELDPDYAKTHYLLGFVHLEEKELDEAVSAFERTVALSPDTPKYVAALVEALARAGRRGDAEKALGELRALAKTRHVEPELIASLAETIERM